MTLNFTRLVPRKSYQHVVEQIQTAICDGDLKQGDRLPSEMGLKETFDTSRGTVREALRVLEQKGLVTIKPGARGGAMVKGPNTQAMSDSMALLIRHQKVSLPHLAEFRELLEGHAAQQAARLVTQEDLLALKEILNEIHAHIQTGPDGWEEFHRLDALFHQALARVGKNPLLQANLTTIHENIHTYFHQFLPFSQALLQEDFEDLCGIMAAVEQGEGDRAKKLAQDHVVRFNQLMEAHVPDLSRPGNP